MMPNYLRYAIAGGLGLGAFLLTAPVSPAAVFTMSASQWIFPGLVGAISGYLGFGPVSNLIGKYLPGSKSTSSTPPSTPDNSSSSDDAEPGPQDDLAPVLTSKMERLVDEEPAFSSDEGLDEFSEEDPFAGNRVFQPSPPASSSSDQEHSDGLEDGQLSHPDTHQYLELDNSDSSDFEYTPPQPKAKKSSRRKGH